jgi:diacylglycerol kinase family enzyme
LLWRLEAAAKNLLSMTAVIPAFVNPAASRADETRAALERAACFDIREVAPRVITEAVRSAVSKGATRIAVAGGDGTLSAGAAAIVGSDVELLVVPAGTLNHFARDHGIPIELDAACALATSSNVIAVDVARVNGRIFLNTSSVGMYSTFVRLREHAERLLGYWLASAVAALRTMIRAKPFHLRLETESMRRHYRTHLVFIGVGERDLRIAAAGERKVGGRSGLHLAVLRSWKLRYDEMLVKSCSIEQRHSTVALDGEVVRMDSPLEYSLEPKALRVVVPPSTI